MRRFLPCALIALAIATPLYGSEDPVENERVVPEPVEITAPEAEAVPRTPQMRLDVIQVEERVLAEEAEAAQWPRQGSFWWLVGVIVVAAVIVAVVL